MKFSTSEPGRFPQRPGIKPDRPRAIDRYIDYFGDGAPASAGPRDPSGESALDESGSQ